MGKDNDDEIKKAFEECETLEEFKKRCPLFYCRFRRGVEDIYKVRNAHKEITDWCNSK